jgi:hypothetical protein
MSKAGVVDPACAHGVGHGLLAEAVVLEQLVGDALAQRLQRDGRLSSQTPTIIIRLTSLSMRSQAVSTRDMRSARGAAVGPGLRRAGDAVHRVSPRGRHCGRRRTMLCSMPSVKL